MPPPLLKRYAQESNRELADWKELPASYQQVAGLTLLGGLQEAGVLLRAIHSRIVWRNTGTSIGFAR